MKGKINRRINRLIYTIKKQDQRTIRKHFINHRNKQIPPIPERCDNLNCFFFSNPLIWNGSPLNLILDHINGVNSDNRPNNLRFLCPNCNSQLDTNAGKNRGKVKKSDGGFAIRGENGFNYHLPNFMV